jgi:hypothetical protein
MLSYHLSVGSPSDVFFRFPVKNMYAFVSSLQACRMARLSNIWRATKEMKLLIMQFISDSARSNGDCVKKGSFADRHGCFGHSRKPIQVAAHFKA